MKARLEELSLGSKNASFLCYNVKVPSFDFLWHYHPEYELTYIKSGKGKRFVGDSYEDFESGDLALLGSMLPHTWVSDTNFERDCEAIVIQFSKAFVESLFQYPEMHDILSMLNTAKNGLQFNSNDGRVISLLNGLVEDKGANAFANLIRILQLLCSTASKKS